MSSRLQELTEQRVPFVHATVVRAQVPTSARPGDDAIVLGDGSIEGFVGGQCAESSVRTAALGALSDGDSVLLRVLPSSDSGFPDSPGAQVVVNPCHSGGALEIFLEPKLPAPLVEIVGATPVATALMAIADVLGYATAQSAPGAVPVGAAAVIIASHGRDEAVSIRAALDAGVAYIALVASPRRGAVVLDELGCTDSERARISTPAGLDLGARTAGEVALSILAEVVASVRRPGDTVRRPGDTVRRPGDTVHRPADGATAATDSSGAPTVQVLAGPSATAPLIPASPATAIDPVCGMTVTIMQDTPRLVVGGETFWFCNPRCRDTYAMTPGR
jgi:xanthine dehydrogenase accessory factor